ncbi:MAG: alpha/beta hydrolase [Rubrivivax sp.]|nr:alpha/beta hydrolase [Rubrivivax sp.]
MAINLQLDPEVRNLALALGIAKPGGTGVVLDEGFFAAPWERIGTIFSNDTQRAALVSALESLLRKAEPVLLEAAGATSQRSAFPLIEDGKPGQVFVVVTREGAAPSAPLLLSVLAEVHAADAGPGVLGEVTLLRAAGGRIDPVAGSREFPLRIEASAPVSANGARLVAALKVVAPPDHELSRLNLRIDGLAHASAPIEFDLTAAQPPVARLAALLLDLLLAQIDPNAPPAVQRVAAALPVLLGLSADLPPLPLQELAHDPSAMPRWIAQLVTSQTAAGDPALVRWFEAIGGMLGAPPLVAPLPRGDAADPAVLTLLAAGANTPFVALTAGVRSEASNGAKVLVVGVRVGFVAPFADVQVHAEAAMLSVPLDGQSPVHVLEQLDLRIEAPAAGGRLVDPADTGGAVSVGSLRAGLRLRTTGPQPVVEPALELDDVTVDLDGHTSHFDRLDFTDASSLTGAAQTLLSDAIDAGLGSGAPIVQALRTLLGLATTPGLDFVAFAQAPTRAIAAYYRALRATDAGWTPILRAVATLLGNGEAVEVRGEGRADEPWTVDLELFGALADSPLALRLALWDSGDAGTPKLVLGLQAAVSVASGYGHVGVAVLEAELPPSAPGTVRWLGQLTAMARLHPPAPEPEPGGVLVWASGVRLQAAWQPGTPLALNAALEALTVRSGDAVVELGTLVLPPPGAPDLSQPDLGLGLDGAALWDALRLLLSRAAGSWAGPAEQALLALLGIAAPGSGFGAVPPLSLDDEEHLGRLLGDPLAALRSWLGGLLTGHDDALAEAGRPHLVDLLELLQSLLTDRLTATGPAPADHPVRGAGTLDEPWTVPLESGADPGVALAFWIEPDGPPLAWSQAVLEAFGAAASGADELLRQAASLTGHAPWLAGALGQRDSATAAAALAALSGRLAGGDGWLSLAAATPASAAWEVAAPVDASHDGVLRHPDAVVAVRDAIDRWTTGLAAADWCVVLTAPPLAGADAWAALLDGIDRNQRAAIDLRVPGTPPRLVDLGTVAPASWYTVDLADDGSLPRADTLAAYGRVIAAVRAARPASKLILVAHSYTGLVAEAYAALNPAIVLGLVALAAPLGAGTTPPAADADLADALRLCAALAPLGLAGAPASLDAALNLLGALVERRPVDPAVATSSATAMARPEVWRRPGSTAPALGTVQALAIPALIEGDLVDALAGALATAVTGLAAVEAPRSLCWGIQVTPGLPAPAAGQARADARLTLRLGQLDLAGGPPTPPTGWIDLRVRIHRPGGWLVGSALPASASDVGIRWVELAGVAVPGSPRPRVDLALRLHDLVLRGTATPVADLADPRTAEGLDAFVRTLEAEATPGSHLDAFLGLLADVGLVRRKATGVSAGLLADGLQGLRSDAAGWLAARLPALLDRADGFFSWRRDAGALPAGGPWRLACGALPLECVIEPQPWRLTVRTTGAGLPIGGVGRLKAVGTVGLNDPVPQVHGDLQLAGLGLARDTPGAPLMLTGAWLERPLQLVPGDPQLIGAALAQQVPQLLVNATLSLLVEQSLAGSARLASLDRLLRAPGAWLAESLSATATGLLQADRVNALLAALARLARLPTSAAQPLQLPGGLAVSASNLAGTDPVLRLALDTAAPIPLGQIDGADATLGLDLRLDIDGVRQVRPGGALVLRVPLPAAAGWRWIELTLGVDAAGPRLAISASGGVQLTLLPQVSGLETLASAAAQQLLPAVLDGIVGAVHGQAQPPAALDDVLTVATAMGIHDGTVAVGSGFRARGTQIASFVADLGAGRLQTLAAAIGPATATLLQRLFGANLVPTPSAPGRVGLQLGGVLGGQVGFEADFNSHPVAVRLRAQAIAFGAVQANIDVGIASTQVVAAIDLQVTIDTGAGLVLTPGLGAGLTVASGARLDVQFRPLGTDEIVVTLAPMPAPPTPQQLLRLAEAWLIPLAGTLLLRAAEPVLATPLWNGSSKSILDLLLSAELAVRDGAGALALKTPLPTPPFILRGILDAFTGNIDPPIAVPLPGGFALRVLGDAHRYGIALSGAPRFDIGDFALTLHLGLPPRLDSVWGDAGRGIGLLLLDLTDPTAPAVSPVLRLGGLGAKFGRKDAAKPLVDKGGFRLGAAGVFVRADIALAGPGAPTLIDHVYGAVEVDGLGLLIAPGSNSGNPVAGSLVQPGGSGDKAPANPPFDVLVATTPGGFAVKFSGEPRLRIQVRKTFGPLHIEEIDILYREAPPGPGEVGLGLDASLALAGLKVQADDLTLFVPLDAPGNLSRWKLDLSGLSVSLSTSSVSISGGLLKTQAAGTIEYRGSLAIEVAGYGLSALGAYARPTDSQGAYTSLFVFLAISAPLGGPPYLFITGVAGGVGVNRRLLTPRDPAAVPSFPLVQAMDGPAASDPMQQLQRIGDDIPPSRGAFWLAAGVRFSTFELLRTTALLTVSLDRGVEVTLMGLMRLNLPPAEDATIISLELALAAKYSTVDQVLSVQAALTSNSWLLSRDCRLTGGFAFVIWFNRPEVLLTVGGYSSKFQVPEHYPNVPRVGFHWNVAEGIVIKGEQFFALTHSAAMVGGALEASYNIAPIHVWFSAGLDIVIWWDPFHYAVGAHIEIGAEVKVEGEILGIKVSLPPLRITVGAWLELEGPPLRGMVLIDLGIAKFPIPFGEKQVQPFLSWDAARDKYLGVGSAASIAAGATSAKGQPDGSEAAPWFVGPQFALRIESKMPASAWRLGGRSGAPAFAPATVDVVPCGTELPGPVSGVLEVVIERRTGPAAWQPLTAAELAALEAVESAGQFPGAVWDGGAATTDASGQPTVDTSRGMVAALGTLELRSALEVREATGKMADVAVAGLLEEETPHPLPFGPAAPPPPVLARRRAVRAARVPEPAPEPAAVPAPRLRATLAAPQERVSRATPAAPAVRARDRAAPAGTLLAAGGAQVWEVAVEQPHRVKAVGAARRVVALSGAGVVLCDTQAGSRGSRLPDGVRTVVLADAPAGESCGWELATPLVRAGSGAFVAPGATLLLPRPWSPRLLPGRQPQAWVQAAEITAEVDGTTTRFPVAAGSAPTLVVVRVDRRLSRADLRRITITARGAMLGERSVVRHGSRVDITLPVTRLERDTTALSVTVHCGEGWRLAGVLGLRGAARRAAARAAGDPHVRHAAAPAARAKPAQVSLDPLPARRKR